MTKFISKRHFSLDFLGGEWKDCFIIFSSLSVVESRDLMNQKIQKKEPGDIIEITLGLLKEHFDSGVGFDSETKSIVKLTIEDLGMLPSSFMERAILFLVGEDDSKSV